MTCNHYKNVDGNEQFQHDCRVVTIKGDTAYAKYCVFCGEKRQAVSMLESQIRAILGRGFCEPGMIVDTQIDQVVETAKILFKDLLMNYDDISMSQQSELCELIEEM